MILLLSNIKILCNCVYLLLAYPAIQSMVKLGKINKHLSISLSVYLCAFFYYYYYYYYYLQKMLALSHLRPQKISVEIPS